MNVTQSEPYTQYDKENTSMNHSSSSSATNGKIILSNAEMKTMASKIRDLVANTSDNEVWNHEGLIECLVELSFTMKGPKENILVKRKISVPLLNSCRKIVKESTVAADTKVAFRLLRVAVHGIRAIAAAEGENLPKPEAIIKLLYHIISTLDSIAHKRSSVSRTAAYYAVWSFETLGLVLRSCCSDCVVSELTKTVKSDFPVPRFHHKQNLSLTLSKEQLLTIGNHAILSCSKIFLLPLWNGDDSPLRTEDQLLLRCLPVGKRLRPHESIHISARLICDLGRPWLLELLGLKTGGSLKEAIALSRRAHKMLWECVGGHEEMAGHDAVLMYRKQSIECLLSIIPRQAHEIKETDRELFGAQFASACSQASKAMILSDQQTDTCTSGLEAFLKSIGEELDWIARLLDDAETGSYIEFCAYRALYGGSMGAQVTIQSNDSANACIFRSLPYRFQYPGTSKVESQFDHAALAVVFLALDVVKKIEYGQAFDQDVVVMDYLLGTVQNFKSLVSGDCNKSKVGLQVWFKILYKTSLNKVTSKLVESNASHTTAAQSALFLAAELLHRCCWPLAKAICSTVEGPKKSSVWDFGSDCVMKSISAYQKLHSLQYREEEVRSCLNEIVSELCSAKLDAYRNCQERAAKLFALNGKIQIDQDKKERAIFSMLYSIRLYKELSRNGVPGTDFQISLRWSTMGTIYSSMSYWEEATVAFIMALVQDVEECTPGPEELASGCWLAFFKFLSSFSNAIFHADKVEERFQSPRRLRLVYKIIHCIREWDNTKGRASLPWHSVASQSEVIDLLLGNQIRDAEHSASPADNRSRLENVLSILFRMDDLAFNQLPQPARHLDHVAFLALLHNQVQKDVIRDSHQELLRNAQNVSFRLLRDNIQTLMKSPSEAFWGELTWILLQMNEACESPRIARSDLSRLTFSLGELGRCPEGGWDLLVLSFRLSLRAKILMEETICEPDDFDELMTDASRFSNSTGSCVAAEGSFARACATGALSRLRDFLFINGYELAATFCAVWCNEHSTASNDLLMPWSNSQPDMQLRNEYLPLIDYANAKSINSTRCTSDDLAMKASSFLAAVPQAQSPADIMHLRKELHKLLKHSESITSSRKSDVSACDAVTNHWIKSTTLLGLAELEEICGDYLVSLDCIKECFSECNKIAAMLVSHLPIDRNEAFELRALRSQCTVRQIVCLQHLCTVYHLSGDYRRAWGYAEVVWKDFSGLENVHLSLKSSLSDIWSVLSSQPSRSPLQKLLRRNLITAKIRSSPLDAVVDDLQIILTEEDYPLNDLTGNGEQIVDIRIEDVLDILLIWDTFGSEYSLVSLEAIQNAEQLSKDSADSLLGSSLIIKLLQVAGRNLELRKTVCCRPLLELDLQLRSLEYRLHRQPHPVIEEEETNLLERTVADPFLNSSLRGRALYILARVSLSSIARNNCDDAAASGDLADVRQYFVSALQSTTTFSQQRIRDIYRCIALSSMGDGVSNKSICRFVASSIGRCLGGVEPYTAVYHASLMEVSRVTSELNIEVIDNQGSQAAKVISDEAFDRLEQLLPPSCRIIMAALAPTGQLIASSIGSLDSCLTYRVAKYPCQPQSEYSFYDEFLKPFDEIIYKSHEQLGTTGECNSDDRKSKKVWWELREKLDSDLMELLARFERKCCSSSDLQSVFGSITNKSTADTPCKKLISRFEAASHDDRYSSQNNEGSPSDLKVSELRDELMSYGFETKRIRKLRKAELVELVTEQRQAIAENIDIADGMLQDREEEEEETVVLILDENLQRFPFESLPCFRGKTVCRMPSLAFMISMLNQRSSGHFFVDKSNVSYVIDPESNLEATQERLYPVVSALHKSIGGEQWKGVVGRIPEDGFMQKSFLEKNGLLLYIGHGGGESLLSRSEITALPPEGTNFNRSSVILMGCSSGRLESVNRRNSKTTSQLPIHYEPEGIALSYLLAGAPCVVGNLWDVTDGDIDRYTESLLSSMFDRSGRSIAQCVSDARDACKMKYLVGCAPVCYGMPVFVQKE